MSTKETIHTNKSHVICMGKEAPFDHPRVFLEIDEEMGFVECPYCSKKFILTESN